MAGALLLASLGCGSKVGSSPEITKSMENAALAKMDGLIKECRVCHGVEEAQRGPILDGMQYWYLYDQLLKFRSGIRGQNSENRSEHLMGIGVKKVSNDLEAAYLADWFSRQEPKPAVRTVKGDLEKGRVFYQSRCASCHGSEAQGNQSAGGPSLNRLEGWYFLDQMRKFRSGLRGSHPMDQTGKTMAAAAKEISDGTLRDLVFYVVREHGPPDDPWNKGRNVPAKSVKPF